ncbi:Ldh family oxidoreductase [Candidatus Poribacteria bacterium]|nr:Ldh family oxidoreductase [Candidatus Poribacteria bacterium]
MLFFERGFMNMNFTTFTTTSLGMSMHILNVPPDEFIRVSVDDLTMLTTTLFQRAGVPPDDADLITKLLIDTDLRGVLSHGTRTVSGYIRQFLQGNLNPKPQVRVLSDELTTAVVDGDGGLGHPATYRATELAIAKAKATGLGAATTRNHGHFGSSGKYARMALRQDCVGFCVSGNVVGSDPNRSVWGSMGNPPMCFAIPGGSGPPLILDMGTIFFDRAEHFPALFEAAPAAFFKSIGLAAVSNLLSGVLGGTMLEGYSAADRRYPSAVYGAFICAINIARFVPVDAFKAEVDRIIQGISQMQPFPGYDRTDLPGGLEWDREQLWSKEGIPLGKEHQRGLEDIAVQLAVPVPWAK